MKLLAFRLFGDLAHFRKIYTTSSPLTYPFPPPTTVRGIVGAILGFSKNEYIKKTESLKIGIRIEKPIKKIRLGLNLIFTKGKSGFDPTLIPSRKGDKEGTLRTQIKAEFVKEPSYIIYIYSETGLQKELCEFLKEHKCVYTVSLGLSELLADFQLVGEPSARKVDRSKTVHSVIPVSCVKKLDLSEPLKIGKERIPVDMNPGRVVARYEDVIFPADGKAIKGEFEEIYELEDGSVIWMT